MEWESANGAIVEDIGENNNLMWSLNMVVAMHAKSPNKGD